VLWGCFLVAHLPAEPISYHGQQIVGTRLQRFMPDPPDNLQHIDFDVKSTKYKPLRDQDYSWEEQVRSLAPTPPAFFP
jgi:hypothetical protein